MSARPDRRTELLDATLRLIGEGGLSGVTHRAVEAAAGLPHGSTTYYFKTRTQLIDAAVERMVELDHAGVDAIAHEIAMALAARDELDFDRVADGISAWIAARPEIQLVRWELSLAGTRRREIAAMVRRGRESFVRLLMPIAAAIGSSDPPRDASTMLALLDGLLFHAITDRGPDDPPARITARDIRRVLAAASAENDRPS